MRQLPLVERRVEAIRGLRFRRPLRPQLVTGAQARRTGLAELDRLQSPAAQAADTQLLALLGLIPPGTSLRSIDASILQDQVAGFYDTETKRLALVSDSGSADGAIGEITLAHELTHALDDQSFGIHDVGSDTDDRALAYSALAEGDATAVMSRYAQRYLSRGDLLAGALGSAGGSSSPGLPPYIEASLEFPYLTGAQFLGALYDVARGWKLVDFAFRTRPPASSEQVMHPLKYEADERPLPVRLHVRLPAGWRRASTTTLGEFTTGQMLKLGVPGHVAARAAAGWGGDRAELWTDTSPARSGHAALIVAWRWDTPQDAAEFEQALPAYVRKLRAPAAFHTQGGVTTLAIAPTQAMADGLAVSGG